MRNKKSMSMGWEMVGYLLLALALAVIIILATPGIAEGFSKGLATIRTKLGI